MVNSSTNS